MNTIKTYVCALLLTGFTMSVFSSCTKELDLDEDTKIAIEKQEKIKHLDEIF